MLALRVSSGRHGGLPPAEIAVHPATQSFVQRDAGHEMLGAVLYLMFGLGVCRLAFQRGWPAFLGFALLALAPLLLDLQSLGRGDGLALGFLLAGTMQLLLLMKEIG